MNNLKLNSVVNNIKRAGFIWLFLCLTGSFELFAQNKSLKPLERIDPPNWYSDLRRKTLQLCLYGKNIAQYDTLISKDTLIKVDSIRMVQNSNYLFVYLSYPSISPGTYSFVLKSKKNKSLAFDYTFVKRTRKVQAVNQSDIVYQIFPDRFSNGDSSNDVVSGLREKIACRDSLNARHGGDIQGIINHLDYIQNMGYTAIWLTPTLVNDQPAFSYHGYALTDHYQTDPRFGTNALYAKLGEECEKRGMKLIMDIVPNHIGSKHWMMLDLPDSDYVHRWPEFTRTNYRGSVNVDPYSSNYDRKKFLDGWFDVSMPDVNQRNIHFAIYLTQSYLWWVNYAGLDGFRIDTYSYNDYEFMDKCIGFIRYEYPNLYTAGEIWEKGGVLDIAYFTEKNGYRKAPYRSHLTGAIDFQLFWAIMDGLREEPGWDNGLARIYHVLTHDGLYNTPNDNLIFLDNHDLNRYYTELKEDLNKWKMGMGILFTMRGVPCVYYGTEHLATNPIPRTSDGQIRQDFPGGFSKEVINKFEENGLNSKEKEAFLFLKKLIQLRKSHEVLSKGKLMQFTPEGNSFVYFRYDDQETFMIAINRGKTTLNLDSKRFEERFTGFNKGKDAITNELIELNRISIPADSFRIIQLVK